MRLFRVVSLACLVGYTLLWGGLSGRAAALNLLPVARLPAATPTYDPLAVPVLPENPSEFERGKYGYYFHCMPCHGDLGQGLTDDFRSVWEEHSNCWGRGCHAGRSKDEGFPIPTIVPALIDPAGALARFHDLASLERYLHDTHPPQRPGRLKADEYHALAVYLWVSNHRPLPVESVSTPAALPTLTATAPQIATVTLSPSPAPLTASATQLQSTPTPAPANSRLSRIVLITVIFILLGSLVAFLARRMKRP